MSSLAAGKFFALDLASMTTQRLPNYSSAQLLCDPSPSSQSQRVSYAPSCCRSAKNATSRSAHSLRGKAETCEFEAGCECGRNLDYTDHIIRDVLLNGINNPDIRREVLGTKNILKTPVNDVIALVEGKEMARNALPSSSLSAILPFRRQQKPPSDNPPAAPSQPDRARQAACPDCRALFHVFSEGTRGWNSKTHQTWITCHRSRRRRHRPQQPPHAQKPAVQTVELEPISQIAALHDKEANAPPQHTPTTHGTVHKPTAVTLDHHVFTKEFLACGFSLEDLFPVRLDLTAANRSPIAIDGAFFARLSTITRDGEAVSCRSMVYVSGSVQAMYLSYESMLNLGILSHGFPSAEPLKNPSDEHTDDLATPHRPLSVNSTRAVNEGCSQPDNTAGTCSCPQRSAS
ncbi:uncharacterized protein LOC125560619 [Nematostella vectensis]|uniref:uncharacterized protein LOC125560619 n=1 Tax=Nematostella vectensis TaxID=45351 RepID=UPI002076FEE3|nr:uncharacterized protein LOC125560619 [Nematostella vectensis]